MYDHQDQEQGAAVAKNRIQHTDEIAKAVEAGEKGKSGHEGKSQSGLGPHKAELLREKVHQTHKARNGRTKHGKGQQQRIEIGGKRIEPDFIRLCRRLVRDSNFRGATPDFTLSLWGSVRRNEEENIFPHIGRCTVSVDTTLAYELNVLAPYLRRILPSIEWGSKHHKQCLEILELFEDVVGIESFVISDTSLYREFV